MYIQFISQAFIEYVHTISELLWLFFLILFGDRSGGLSLTTALHTEGMLFMEGL